MGRADRACRPGAEALPLGGGGTYWAAGRGELEGKHAVPKNCGGIAEGRSRRNLANRSNFLRKSKAEGPRVHVAACEPHWATAIYAPATLLQQKPAIAAPSWPKHATMSMSNRHRYTHYAEKTKYLARIWMDFELYSSTRCLPREAGRGAAAALRPDESDGRAPAYITR